MALSNAGNYRLLVVDDDKDNAELIVRIALRCGYESFAVYNARTLREIIPHWRPHVISFDIGLPDVEGFELLAALKASHYEGELIIISGQPEVVRKRAAEVASISGLSVAANLEKPIDVAQLRELLTTMKASLFLSLLKIRHSSSKVQQAKA
jgi:two-component system, chemotaxis family, chemotaxis protein CheY